MRVLIVVPQQAHRSTYQLPVGIGLVSACLKRAGHDVRVLNPNHSTENFGTLLLQAIKEHEPQVIGVGGMAFHLTQIRSIVAASRPLAPHAVIVIGGLLVTNQPEVAMAAIPEADIGVVGEGEHTIVELLAALEEKRPFDDVAGLIYWEVGRTLKSTAPRPIEMDLDALPEIDWEGLGLDVFSQLHGPGDLAPGLIVEPGQRAMPLLTSRGCPYRCTFCCHDVKGLKYRNRSLDSVFAELQSTIDRYGIDTVAIYDDIFCLKSGRLEDFCARIKPLNLRWQCSLRVEQVTPENLALMKESGCIGIGLGVESMSPVVLESMKKKATREDFETALKHLYAAKLTVWANLIFGDPAETMETALDSLEWWVMNHHFDLRTAFIGFHPGSRIYDDALARGLIGDPVAFLLDGQAEINATAMSDEEFTRLREEIVPRYVLSFGLPGRIAEISQDGSEAFAIGVVCPHCGEHQTHESVVLRTTIINRLSCKSCNQLFRLPVRFRHAGSAVALALNGSLQAKLPSGTQQVTQEQANEILQVCQEIIRVDAGDDGARRLIVDILEGFGEREEAVRELGLAIQSNPYNPELFDRMDEALMRLGRDGERGHYIRQAALLRRLGITGPIDIEDAGG